MAILLALAFGPSGVLIAWAIGAVWFVHAFNRPGPRS
jgi:hypothetical protein